MMSTEGMLEMALFAPDAGTAIVASIAPAAVVVTSIAGVILLGLALVDFVAGGRHRRALSAGSSL